jgi:1-pyrroline-4-hydroxy-2-carboxylate deaminase
LEKRDWSGALTTPFPSDFSVHFGALEAQVVPLTEHGCSGIVALASIGEGQALVREEKLAIPKRAKGALKGRALLVTGVSALSTAEAVSWAQ